MQDLRIHVCIHFEWLDEPSISKLHLVHDLGDESSMCTSFRSGSDTNTPRRDAE